MSPSSLLVSLGSIFYPVVISDHLPYIIKDITLKTFRAFHYTYKNLSSQRLDVPLHSALTWGCSNLPLYQGHFWKCNQALLTSGHSCKQFPGLRVLLSGTVVYGVSLKSASALQQWRIFWPISLKEASVSCILSSWDRVHSHFRLYTVIYTIFVHFYLLHWMHSSWQQRISCSSSSLVPSFATQ